MFVYVTPRVLTAVLVVVKTLVKPAVVADPAEVAKLAVPADPADPVTFIDQVPDALAPVVLGAPTVL